VSVDIGTQTTMKKIIDNFISNEEAETLKNYIFDNELRVKALGPDNYQGTPADSLTGRWDKLNWLTEKVVGDILLPKLNKLLPPHHITMWANIFRKGEYIIPHGHGPCSITGNLYLGGPEGSETNYIDGPVTNKVGTMVLFDPEILHWVNPNETNTPRVSMAFDAVDNNPGRTFIPLGTHSIKHGTGLGI